MPLSSMNLVQFLISFSRRVRNAGPGAKSGVMSSLAKRSRTRGSAITAPSALSSIALTSSRSPFGPNTPNQNRSSTPPPLTPPAPLMLPPAALMHVWPGGCGGPPPQVFYRKGFVRAAFAQALGRLHRRDRHRHVAGHDVGDGLAAALVGDVNRLHSDRVLEYFEVEMRDAADAGRRVIHLLRHGPRIGDQFGDGLRGSVVRPDQGPG